MQFPGILVTMYRRNGPKFVMFISLLWYPQKWKKANFSTWKLSSTERGYPCLLCSEIFQFFCYYRLTRPSPSTTLPRVGFLSGRIVIIILLMYSQILYDIKQPNAMLWSSPQIWSCLHPYSVGLIVRKFAATVGFISKYSWLHRPRFSRANISAALAN